jgi:hypothetical protein
MDRDRKLAGVLLVAAMAIGVGACSDDEDAKEPTEKAVEEAEATQEVEVDPDGNVRVTDSEGNVNEFKTSTELPDEWPEALALPESITIVSSNTTKEDDVTALFVTATTETPVADAIAELKAQLEAAGFEILAETVTETEGGGSSGNLGAQGPEASVSISIAKDVEGPASVLYSVTLEPQAEEPAADDEPAADEGE